MKRFLSVALSLSLLCGAIAVTAVSAETEAAVRPTVTLVESGFEDGMKAPFSANESDGGEKATITPVSIADSVNPYLHITDRMAGESSATIQQDILDEVKANGKDGRYYISARIKLDTPGDTAYVLPTIQGTGVTVQTGGGERFAVTDEWTTIGKKSDGSYMAFSVLDPTALTWAKFYFRMYTVPTGQGSTLYDGDYSIDDVVLWFVPDAGAPEKVTTIGDNILTDGTFDANIGTPDAYNNVYGGDSWYIATADGSGAAKDRLCSATVEKETLAAVDTSVVHSGTGALHITNRPGEHQSIAVNLKDVIGEVGPLATGEGYSMSVWMRAEEGKTIEVQPIFGTGGKGSAFIVGGDYTTVTDEWTEVGILNDKTYSLFALEDGSFFDPYGATWANIRLRTKGTDSFYVDDFKVMGPQPAGDAAESFVQGVNALPAPDAITHANGSTIESLEAMYETLDLEALDDEQKAAVAAAKEKLDAAREAYDALPAPKNSFVPNFTYENKANLIAPYGDLESFTANDYIWNEENTEGANPKYTLVTDPKLAHKGNNSLLISNREKSQHAAAFTLTDVIKDNGGGKYYFSAWMRTANPGDEMDVFPLLYIGGLNKEFYIDGDTHYHITNEWTFVGVTYDNLEGYYASQGEEIPDFEDPATYVALRFYGLNETWESEDDGALYPDYYIDDLKVWKEFEGQADYVDPDAPVIKPTNPTNPTNPTTPTNPDGGDKGDTPEDPETGHSLPVALPVLGAVALGLLVVSRKRK